MSGPGGVNQGVVESLRDRLAELTAEVSGVRAALARVAEMSSEATLLTSKEVAPLLGVGHPKTVERWVREKGLPCVRIGRNLRFRHGDVLRWQAQQER